MQELSNGFVCLMGVGIVFFGLVCLVLISLVMSGICKLFDPKKDAEKTQVSAPAVAEEIPNKQELIAAVSAVLAEELGKNVSAIRILSFKKSEVKYYEKV